MRILYAEDERDLNRIVTQKLTAEGYSVDSFFDGEEALHALSVAEYDGAVLDIMIPGADGLQVLARMRAAGSKVPVLLLTARDAVEDRVRGLDSGADDYLIKPFALEELCARVRAMTRSAAPSASGNQLRVGDLTLDVGTKTARRDGKEIALSAKEYALLEYLMRNPGIVLSREKIENHIWNFDYEGGTNVIDVYIGYLRRKLEDGFSRKLIHTVRGLGYVIREDKV